MMNDILDRLFYGEVSPYDDSVEDMETFRELNSKMAEVWSRIDALASPELKELLDLYKVHRADMDMLVQLDRFKVGFRLATQLMVASIGKDKCPNKYTICPVLGVKHCVHYGADITCYFLQVERICDTQKKTHIFLEEKL